MQIALILAALGVVCGGIIVLRRCPDYRHHIVPFGLLVLVLLAGLFPFREDAQYEATVGAIQFNRADVLGLDGELELKAVYVACGGLVVRTDEGRVETGETKQQPFRTLTVSVGDSGQVELQSITPSYVAAEIRYGRTGPKEWRLEASSGRDGVALKLPPEGGSVKIRAGRATVVSHGARVMLDGREIHSIGGGSMTFSVEMLGHYPIEIDGSGCRNKEGYLEFLLSEQKVNQFTVAGSATGLSRLQLQGVRKGTRRKGDKESTLVSNSVESEGLLEHLGPMVVRGGLLEITAIVREPGSLVGRANENPLWVGILAIVGLWMNQLVTHGLRIKEDEASRDPEKRHP